MSEMTDAEYEALGERDADRIVNALLRPESHNLLQALLFLSLDDKSIQWHLKEYIDPEEHKQWQYICRHVDNDNVHSGGSWALVVWRAFRKIREMYPLDS